MLDKLEIVKSFDWLLSVDSNIFNIWLLVGISEKKACTANDVSIFSPH